MIDRSTAQIFEARISEPKTTGTSPPVMSGERSATQQTPPKRNTDAQSDIDAILRIADKVLNLVEEAEEYFYDEGFEEPRTDEHYLFYMEKALNTIIGLAERSLEHYDENEILWIIEGSKFIAMLRACGVIPVNPPKRDDEDDGDDYY